MTWNETWNDTWNDTPLKKLGVWLIDLQIKAKDQIEAIYLLISICH